MVLNDQDYTQIRRIIKTYPDARTQFKTWGLDKQTWKGLFQAAEDWFVNAFDTTPSTSFKSALETAAGAMTNAQAKWTGKVWFQWRIGEDW